MKPTQEEIDTAAGIVSGATGFPLEGCRQALQHVCDDRRIMISADRAGRSLLRVITRLQTIKMQRGEQFELGPAVQVTLKGRMES